MKIALVQKYYSLAKGGAERYAVNLSRQLAALGHQVTVIGEWADEPLLPGVAFRQVVCSHASSWSRNRSFARAASAAVGDEFDLVLGLCRTEALDIYRTGRVHAHWMQVRYGQPLYRRLQSLNPRHRAILELERTIVQSPRVRRIVAQCHLDKRLLIEHYGIPESKVCVIYNGVDTSIFNLAAREYSTELRRQFGIEPGEPLLVFSSVTDYKTKGLSSVLKAMRLARDNGSRLIVLGRGRQEAYVRLARSFGLERRVAFAGYRRDAAHFYAAADLCVLPTAYEPFPNVNLEALACGTPVLTTATNGTAEILDEGSTGYVIPHALAHEDLAARLDQHFALNFSQRSAMSQACWQTAKSLTLSAHVAEIEQLLHEVRAEKLQPAQAA